jgi:phosphatidylglycerol:prolipoprotein diacylglycerol transferase
LSRFFDGSPPTLKLFGGIVAFGVYLGIIVATRHAKERRIEAERMNSFIWWILIGGFACAHILDDVFYHPEEIARNPFHILMLWVGISSYGGFVGALGGALAFRWHTKKPIGNLCEVVNSAFPLAWVFGRLGCSTVHDHPGRVSQSWIAVKYPNLPAGWGRFDLGLYEMLLSIPLAVTFLILWRRKVDRPLGFYTGLMCCYYAPVRFVLDFFRETEENMHGAGDPRYGGLTPAQWGCFGLFAIGLFFLNIARKGGSTMEPEPAPVEGETDDADAEEEAPKPVKKKRKKKPAPTDEQN